MAAFNSPNEVAFLLARSSTAKKGIFPIPVAIDTGYEGIIHAFVVNTTDRKQVFMPGERAFSIVNLVKGKDRVQFEVAKQGKRGSNWNNNDNDETAEALLLFAGLVFGMGR